VATAWVNLDMRDFVIVEATSMQLPQRSAVVGHFLITRLDEFAAPPISRE